MLNEAQKTEIRKIAEDRLDTRRVTFHGDRISVEYHHNKWRDDFSLQQFMTEAHGESRSWKSA